MVVDVLGVTAVAEEELGCEMQCIHPFWVSKEHLSVPCGKCIACRIARAREWSTRLIHELGSHKKAVFVTLTYNDENLPADNSLSIREAQLFMKRLRKAVEPERLKYYITGEYGDNFGRPHYHAIVFGLGDNEDDQKTIERTWNKGYVYCGSVTYDSCRYVADYIMKKYDGKKAKDVYGDKQVPFSKISKGIGKDFAMGQAEYIKGRMGITHRGIEVGIPRYYKKVLEIGPEEFVKRAHEKFEAQHEYFISRVSVACIGEEMVKSRMQREKNLNAQANLYKKGIL